MVQGGPLSRGGLLFLVQRQSSKTSENYSTEIFLWFHINQWLTIGKMRVFSRRGNNAFKFCLVQIINGYIAQVGNRMDSELGKK